MANNQPESVFVSIHFDDAGRTAPNGVETYYAAHPISFPERVASWLPFLQRTSSDPPIWRARAWPQRSRIAHRPNAGGKSRNPAATILRHCHVRHPAVLVEGGFLTNKDEAVKLANADYANKWRSDRDGILRYRDTLLGKETPRR